MSDTEVKKKEDAPSPGEGWANGAIPAHYLAALTRDGRLALYEKHRRWIGLNEGWTRIGGGATELDARVSDSQTGQSLLKAGDAEEEARAVRCLIAQLCENFYRQGWATGTGGGVSIRVGGPADNRRWRVFVAPSGIQKEDMIGDDIFELDMDRNVVVAPKTPNLRQSACTPLWYVVYRNRPTARCVIHTHSINAQLATLLNPTESSKSIKITHLEMLKGVGGHAYDDMLEVPIIDNRPTEDQLADQLEAAIQKYPKSNAVLVRRHGIYVWGDSWEQAKTQCESFDYLFDSAIKMKTILNINPETVPRSGTYRVVEEIGGAAASEEPANKKPRTEDKPPESCWNAQSASTNDADFLQSPRKNVPLLPRDSKILLLDVEGCTTSIAFVKEGLFPYVLERIELYVETLSEEEKLQVDSALSDDIRKHQKVNGNNGDAITDGERVTIPDKVRYLVNNDVKGAALKDLQGKMWKAGYESGYIQGHVYSDFPPTLNWTKERGVKVYIYSSGSIQAQQLLFGHSTRGDLCPFLEGHFDIPTAGSKRDPESYKVIAKSIGVDPYDIVFVSDSEAELVAAQQAGIMAPVLSIRPGNAPLTEIGKGFPSIQSLLQLCGE